jgi:hypothetical protein
MKNAFKGMMDLAAVALGKENALSGATGKSPWFDRIFAGFVCLLATVGFGIIAYVICNALTSMFGLFVLAVIIGVIAISIGCLYAVYYTGRFGYGICVKIDNVKEMVKKLDDKTKAASEA